MNNTFSKTQLIQALLNEYEYLIHDDFDPDEDLTLEQYHQMLLTMSNEQLVKETTTDIEFLTLEKYMEHWGQ